ncbi:glycoside hydrolase family 57 [Myxococcota bacterium]
MSHVHHALGLTMHQPLGNLLQLHNSNERWEARQVLWCYERVPGMLRDYADVARLHLMFSGTLLKQFEDPGIAETFADVVDIEGMLRQYREASSFEFLGSGLYHPVYPLIPRADWQAQTQWWQGLGRKSFGRDWFPGFCPPELGFCQEMIPHLVDAGYRYVLVDCIYIKPRREMRWHEVRFQPFWASHEGKRIIVVPVERELSNAQYSGTEPWWFEKEIAARTQHCDFPALVTTWSDGENGGWFRMPEWQYAFWGVFYRPLMQKARDGTLGFRITSINEFLDQNEPKEEVDLHSGAWNTGHHWGGDFIQWRGSLMQKRGLEEIVRASDCYHRTKQRYAQVHALLQEPEAVSQLIHEAYDQLLVAETSCNFYWGSSWVHRAFDGLEQCYRLLSRAHQLMPSETLVREMDSGAKATLSSGLPEALTGDSPSQRIVHAPAMP